MNADPRTREQARSSRAPGTAGMRAAATWFLDQRTLPRHESLRLWSADLTDFLAHLAPAVEQLAARLPAGDVPARVATAGVAEAHRRLTEPEAAGLHGETERVRRLARSVLALCDHHDTLTGVRMCLTCDKPLDPTRPTQPHDRTQPYGRTGPPDPAHASGRVHTDCADTDRTHR